MESVSEEFNVPFKRATTGNNLANEMGDTAIAYLNLIHPSAYWGENIEAIAFSAPQVFVVVADGSHSGLV